MSILINFKMCDNAKECNGVTVCPTGALSYDDKKKTLVIDNNKCISCGKCVNACPIGAISVTKTEEEYKIKQKEIDDDQRTIEELFVNRYGAEPMSSFQTISYEGLKKQVKLGHMMFIEVYNNDSIECLVKSIPVKEIVEEFKDTPLYYKLESNKEIEEEYGISSFPSLLIFKDGKFIGKVDGYYTVNEKDEFIKKIKKVLKKYNILRIFSRNLI